MVRTVLHIHTHTRTHAPSCTHTNTHMECFVEPFLITSLGIGIENRFLLTTGSQWIETLESLAKVLDDSAIDSSAVFACAMMSHARRLVLFRPQPTCRLGRGVQKCGYISQGHLQCLQNVYFVKGGEMQYRDRDILKHFLFLFCIYTVSSLSLSLSWS